MAINPKDSDLTKTSDRAASFIDETQRAANAVSDTLKTVGVDTDRVAEAATERVSEFQRMLEDEIRARPLRALGWAAAAGLVVGIMAAR